MPHCYSAEGEVHGPAPEGMDASFFADPAATSPSRQVAFLIREAGGLSSRVPVAIHLHARDTSPRQHRDHALSKRTHLRRCACYDHARGLFLVLQRTCITMSITLSQGKNSYGDS